MDDAASEDAAGGAGYEIFIGLLSLLSIVNLVLIIFIQYDAGRAVVYVIDGVLSLVFLGDFLWRFRRAPSRSTYFWRRYGWADLLASMPFPQMKLLRVFRLLRVVRLVRGNGVGYVRRSVLRDRAGSALLSLLFVAILVLEFGSLLMLRVESGDPDANITNASDALWYVIVTMSTVGYGDQYPVTNAGRNLGAFIIVLGVGIFGTLTGFLANAFLAPRRAEEAPVSDARERLTELESLLAEQQRATADLRRLLDG
ncbi:MAG TPA: ion transporter [Nocardioides sp.]|uniref:ion transporter n=1 Tax=Nocardioides sp. TaxID=35761 RepID=UPI002B5496DF|nr:ion transporter [Nocardioides sp.]HQR27230.1 ion transporter [Nocardioides sp.]